MKRIKQLVSAILGETAPVSQLDRVPELIALDEAFSNLWKPAEKSRHAQAVWEMLQKTYAPLGGFKSYASVEEMIQAPGLWKLP